MLRNRARKLDYKIMR
ncbi:hypothetical protein ACOQ27_001063 [Escherichia coli]|nr:hypothetical protein [Escherichia coli]